MDTELSSGIQVFENDDFLINLSHEVESSGFGLFLWIFLAVIIVLAVLFMLYNHAANKKELRMQARIIRNPKLVVRYGHEYKEDQ